MNVALYPKCEWCREPLIDRPAGTRHCDNACRASSWRAAQAADWRNRQPHPAPPAQPDTSKAKAPRLCRCERPIPELNEGIWNCFKCGSPMS